MSHKKIRVLIVEDSPVIRQFLEHIIARDPRLEIAGAVASGEAALKALSSIAPDVISMDVRLPGKSGMDFQKELARSDAPLPVIIMSSLSQRGSDFALEALRLGAFDVLAKPGGPYSFGELGPQLIARIKASAGAKIRGRKAESQEQKISSRPPIPVFRPPSAAARHPRDVILLGASTGGTEALREVLTRLPGGLPGIAIVQHIPPVFSKSFADRLNQLCAFDVREAVDGDRLTPGLALIAPGNFHLMLQWAADHYRVRVVDGPPVWHQRPAVDLLFKSAADCGAAPHALAGIFTGMGRDGADGLLRLRERGATTFAQDEASSVVYGMPKAAWENGAAQRQIPLHHAADFIVRHHEAAHAGSSVLASP